MIGRSCVALASIWFMLVSSADGTATNDLLSERLLTEQIQSSLDMIQVPDAWAAGYTGKGVRVCIIDSGVNAAHEDLKNIPKTGVTGTEGSVEEWDFDDTDGTGTLIAGVIAAQKGNNIGIAGVAPGVSLHIVDVTDAGLYTWGGDILNAAEECVSAGAQIINLSIGSCDESCTCVGGFNQTESDGYDRLKDLGILVVASAGDEGACTERLTSYPASYDSVVSVTAVDAQEVHSPTSNVNSKVELAAPGTDILSTYIDGTNVYAEFSGTTMATPHVAGVAALVWEAHPELTVDELRSVLQNTAKDKGAAGRDSTYGFGIVQAMDAIDSVVVHYSDDCRRRLVDIDVRDADATYSFLALLGLVAIVCLPCISIPAICLSIPWLVLLLVYYEPSDC